MSKKQEEQKTEDLLHEISEKLDKIMGVLAIQGKDEDKQIEILKKLGFKSNLTGALLGLKESAVRNRKSWKES